MKRTFTTITFAAIGLGSLIACEPKESAEARSPASEATPAVTALPPASAAVAARFVTDPAGTAARYRIREQLVGVDFPNDAIGETKEVTGVISADAKGNLIPAESKFTVGVSTLASDKQRRDGFVRGRVLEADKYPTVTLVPTSIKGISMPLPKSGSKTFEILGDLTVRGVTHPTTWKVNAQFQPNRMTGKATTAFTFADFAIDQPRVPVVLSVADTIKLELDFALIPDPSLKK
jgi:polyisoprenoid-binding protein YceI